MGSRNICITGGTIEKKVVTLYGNCVLSTAGVVTSVKGSGIKSIVKESGAGRFTITLDDGWNRLLMSSWGMISADGYASGIAAVEVIEVLATPVLQAGIKAATGYKIQLLDFTGAAANPANTCVFSFSVDVRNSEVTGKGE